MSSDEEHEANDSAELRRNQRSNRRALIIIGIVTTAVIGWNLYVQVVAR